MDGVVGGHVAGVQRDHDVERRRVVVAHIALLVVHAFELELADDALAQLHQLRGRVGRGEFQSYCIFISTSEAKETMERLQILNHSNDGFHIASEDLKLRGPGDIFGIRQSGEFAFVLGDIYTDANILKEASDAVEQLLVSDPELTDDDSRALVNYFKEHTAVNVVDFRTI